MSVSEKTIRAHFARTSPGQTRSGVTLLDLVITVLIISILTAAAAPRFADALHRSRAEAAAGRIRADLGWVRQYAISTSKAQTVRFTPPSDVYDVTDLKHTDNSGQPYVVYLSAEPYKAQLVASDLGGDNYITFDLHGQPDTGGTITVKSGGYQQTVTVDPGTGKATVP